MATIHEITEDWQREGLSPTWVKLQAAQAEFDALAADAARYRWLTENKHVPWGAMKLPINILLDNGIDAAIDAAMKGE